MLTSQTMSSHLPCLRRYARALTGGLESGDKYVEAALRAVVDQPDLIEDKTAVRVEIFRVFSKIWNSLAVNGRSDPIDPHPANRHLSQIGPMPRQAFLLVSLEGFSEDEASRILGVSVAGLRELIGECGRERASQIASDMMSIECGGL